MSKAKKEYNDKHLSEELEDIIESRGMYVWREGSEKMPVINVATNHFVSCAMPIISEGDVVGCVASLAESDGERIREMVGGELESKLVLTAAGFLGKQLES